MVVSAAPALSGRPAVAGAKVVAGVFVLLLLAVGLVPAIDGTSTSLAKALAGGLGMASVLALAIARYDLAVGLGFFLQGVVLFEPAPPDAVFAIVIAVAVVTGRFHITRAPRSVLGLLALLIVLNLVSMLDAVGPSAAVRFFFITAYLAIFAIWMCGYVDSRRRAKVVVVAWLAIAALSAVLAILAVTFSVPYREVLLNTARARALFEDPNVYGPFLVPITVILLEQRLSRAPLVRMRAWTSTALLLTLALGILFSYSRAAWANTLIAVLIMLGCSAFRRAGAQRAMGALVGLLLVGVAVVSVIETTGSVGFLDQRAKVQSYDTQRFGAQRFGYELGWTHPIGIGPGQFQFHYPVESHSTYVRVMSEQGILGIATWIGVLLTTLVLAIRNVALGRDTYGIGSAALLGAWCGLIFNSAVVDTLHWRHLWMVAALIWAGAMRDRVAAQKRRRAERAAALVRR